MELHKLTVNEVRGWDESRLKDAVNEVKKSLAELKMDVYSAKSANSGKIRGYKKALARIKTVQTERGKQS